MSGRTACRLLALSADMTCAITRYGIVGPVADGNTQVHDDRLLYLIPSSSSGAMDSRHDALSPHLSLLKFSGGNSTIKRCAQFLRCLERQLNSRARSRL
jgi:hypothetical protein